MLLDLYLKKKLSSYQISKQLNCSQALVMKKLKLFRIPTRTIQQGKALTPPKYPRKDFCGSPEEKAYLLGFRYGDLYISKTHPDSPTIRASTNSGKLEQLSLVRDLFCKYGHVKEIGPDKQGAVNIRCYLNNSFSFLINKAGGVPKEILGKRNTALAFFAGYVDAEGTFSINYRNQPVFSIKTQDKHTMAQIQSKILPRIGVKTRLQFVRAAGSVKNGVKSNKDVYGVFVYNKRDLGKIISNLLPYLKHEKRKGDALKVLTLINHVGT